MPSNLCSVFSGRHVVTKARRALMVSALAYVLYAMNAFFRGTGDLTISLALSALIAGAALLLLSAYWRAARRGVLALSPARLRARLPAA